MKKISENIVYAGVDDLTLDLFEGQYPIPLGVSYNSYVILDNKIAVMDSVDKRAGDEWFRNIETILGNRKPDYIIVQHLEPDHSANVEKFALRYPEARIVCSVKAAGMIGQFFESDLSSKIIAVKEGDTLSLGEHNLTFVNAPMVHWPEVIMSYESTTKTLFSADAFGKFGALCKEDEGDGWACEARRYYFNIVGKYGAQVQALFKKLSAFGINTICPLHGPILDENLGYYLGLYDTWSQYAPETQGVFIAYASMHGNTKKAAEMLEGMLSDKGVKVAITDLSRCDIAEAVEDAFRYDRMVLAAPTYDGGLFTKMEEFLLHLEAKGYKNRKVAIIENGSWAPMAAKKMKAHLETFKDITFFEPVVTIKTTVKQEVVRQLELLAKNLQ
ncbi:MAG: FprA family A-type flavoprotein [Bacteroidales bacterium]|mgnify:CR=1 FL=1|nr:FprA family A-type flavoprotein [Bacteroidales bacterium]